jgi:hypothetical protein
VQALGGAGYTKDWPVERYLRDAKLLDIGAGTNEVRRMLIGRELIGAAMRRADGARRRGSRRLTHPRSPRISTFQPRAARAAHNRALARDWRSCAAALGGDARSRERHVARGKLLPRERVGAAARSRLAPAGSQLAAGGLYGDEVPARRDHRDRPGIGPPV